MKNFFFLASLCIAAFAATPPLSPPMGRNKGGGIPSHYSKVDFPQWSYAPPYPKDYRVELKDGAVAYLVPDSTLDVVKLSLVCDRPNLPNRPEETAALQLYSDLLKDGGTQKLTPEQLEDTLEFIAASL